MIQRFVIQGNPRGQGRPRAFVRGRHPGHHQGKVEKTPPDLTAGEFNRSE